jgi:uncharacterized protein GlcG (DUF336 family)
MGTAAVAAGAVALAPTLAPTVAGAASRDDASSKGDAVRPTITLAEAQKLLEAAEAKANEINVPMYVVIVDESGRQAASIRMDRTPLAALTLVPPKAFTAVSFRTPTHVLAQSAAADPVRVASFLASGEFTLLGGGFPIVRSGAVIGAIGVGGGTPDQDVVVGQAALTALAG